MNEILNDAIEEKSSGMEELIDNRQPCPQISARL